MNYLQSILSLDADALTGIHLRHDADLPEIFSPSPEQRLAEALRREAECTATFVAVSASIANALSVTGKGRVCAQALQTFAHLDMPLLTSAMPALLDGGKLAAILEPAQALLFRLALAGRLSTAFAREAGLPADRQTVHCATLCDAWRNACTSAIGLLFAVNEFGAKDRCNPASTASQPLIDLLLRAANGGHPCVEDDGCVIVPGWAERRRHERIEVNLPAQLRSDLGTFDIRIVDVSQSGLGIKDLPAGHRDTHKSGQQVEVHLADGRQLSGQFAWIAGSLAGLTLHERLAANDPLFCH